MFFKKYLQIAYVCSFFCLSYIWTITQTKIKKQYLLLIGLLISILASCSSEDITGNGPVVSETRAVNEFNSIRSEISADIYLTQDVEQSFRLESNANVLAVLEAKVVNGELIIESDHNIRGPSRTQTYISAADFRKISITGSGSLESINCMDLDDLKLSISGSANVSFCGTVNQFTSSISGSGNINAYGLNSKNASITIEGSGNFQISVSDLLTANIYGSGDIQYKGDPSVNSKITGSGKVVKAN